MSKLLNLSEGTYLALHGLVLIANKQPERISIKYIAVHLDASMNHLAKIFQKLSKAGIVNSIRGPQGGFELNRDPKYISFLEIIELFEGTIEVEGCPFGKSKCPFRSCIVDGKVFESTKEIYNRFKEMTLADF